MIIVFPFIVLKYFSFCCHSSHSVLCCNRLSYSYFILIVKSDSKFNLNFSCYLSFLLICLLPISVYSLFFLTLLFLFQDRIFFMHFVFSVTLSLLLLCLSSFSFSCYFVFMSFCLFSSFCRTSFPPFFPFILASFLLFHLFIF